MGEFFFSQIDFLHVAEERILILTRGMTKEKIFPAKKTTKESHTLSKRALLDREECGDIPLII